MAKVLVTLDFDGVVSPIDHDRNFRADSDFEMFRIGGFQCAISKETLGTIQRLKKISMEHPELLEVIWASSWVDLTETFHIETNDALPELGFLEIPASKAESISKHALATDARTVIVLEDGVIANRNLKKVWNGEEFIGRELILFKPKLETGLTHELNLAIWDSLREPLGNAFPVEENADLEETV